MIDCLFLRGSIKTTERWSVKRIQDVNCVQNLRIMRLKKRDFIVKGSNQPILFIVYIQCDSPVEVSPGK